MSDLYRIKPLAWKNTEGDRWIAPSSLGVIIIDRFARIDPLRPGVDVAKGKNIQWFCREQSWFDWVATVEEAKRGAEAWHRERIAADLELAPQEPKHPNRPAPKPSTHKLLAQYTRILNEAGIGSDLEVRFVQEHAANEEFVSLAETAKWLKEALTTVR